jgi:hypothetical protein
MYLNTATTGFNPSQLSTDYPDVGAVQADYFDQSTFVNQQPSNPAAERNLIEE